MDNVTKLFKTSAFGFNRSDVVNYIEKTRNDFYDYKIQTERTINELNEKIKELQSALEAKESAADDKASSGIDLSSSVFQINEAADHLRETADKICDDIGGFLDKILSSDKEFVTPEINYEESDIKPEQEFVTVETASSDSESENEDIADDDKYGFMLQFSQIISNTFVEKKEASVEEKETLDKPTSGSILDGLLGSSVFSE